MKRLARSRERIAVKGRGRSSRYEKTCCEKDEEECGESMGSRVSNSAADEHARVGLSMDVLFLHPSGSDKTYNRKDRKTSYQLPGTDPELY